MRFWRWTCLGLCALVLAGNAWHIFHNATPPAWDDAWYLENSFRFFHALKRGLLPFLGEYIHAFRIKAPLISLLPLPFYLLAGPSERAALWVNEVLFALQLLCVHAIGRKLYSERAGLAAAAAAALIPLAYGLSRIFLVECLMTTLTTLFLLLILEERPKDSQGGWALGTVLGLGLLAKSIFPLYALGPLWLKRRYWAPHAKKTLLIAAAIASTWYGFNAVYVAAFGLNAGFGRIARDYGGSNALYGMSVGRDALSWPYLAAAAAVLAAAWRCRPRGWRLGPSEKLLLSWLAVPLTVLLLGVNKDIRYLAPALPALAILLGAAAASASRRPAMALIIALAALPPSMVFLSQTFGWPAAEALVYNGPPAADSGWNRAALIDALASQKSRPTVVAVAFEHRFFNANNLASLAAERGYDWRFVNLGYAQSSPEAALIRLKDKEAEQLILVKGAIPDDMPPFLNKANEGIALAVESGRLRSEPLFELPIAPGLRAAGYKLTR